MTRMDPRAAVDLRLVTQGLAGKGFERPESVVRCLTAVQSQDFPGAKWAVGQRCPGNVDAGVQLAFDEGRILRTHILRPTWHFVAPSDIRWMQNLTSPHVKQFNGTYLRKLELDDALLARSQDLMTTKLGDGNFLTRKEIGSLLESNGIPINGLRLGFIMMAAELEALICSGPMRGKQHTYALLDERVSDELKLTGDEALAELTRRFFVSHGPATVREYARWSGFTLTTARRGLEFARDSLVSVDINDQVHWFDPSAPVEVPVSERSYLLSEYDECYMTYPEVNFPDLPWTLDPDNWSDTFFRPIIINGHRAGTWRRTIAPKDIDVEANLFATLDRKQRELLKQEVERYGSFFGFPAEVKLEP